MEITKLFSEEIFENLMANTVATSQLPATRDFVMWILAYIDVGYQNPF